MIWAGWEYPRLPWTHAESYSRRKQLPVETEKEKKKKIELIKQIFPLIKFSIVFLSIEYSGVNSTHATGGIASPPHLLIFSSFLSPHPSLSAAALHFTASSLSFSSFLLLIKLQLRFRHISFNWLRCALSSNPYFCLSILLTAPEHNHHFTSLIWPTWAIPIPTEPVRYVFRI